MKNAASARPADPFAIALGGLRLRSARPAPAAPSVEARPDPLREAVALRDPKPMRPSRPAKVRPVTGAVTGLFGENRGGRPHAGVDLDGEIGDPVVSAGAGLVVHAGPPPQGMSGYGNVVIVNHPDGTQAMYAHLSAIATLPGTVVEPGTLIGAVGVSGSVTGSHLHWEMRIGDTPIDPLAWLGV
ncbi:MAG TPA: M23 family metallopeptidase [Acidimicrobiales bacterium]|nr:M23 family metallopeptidase [Acidimicrobiales bacterium]